MRLGGYFVKKTAALLTGKILPVAIFDDPFPISGKSIHDRPQSDGRNLIAVKFRDPLDKPRCRIGLGLEDRRNFLGLFDRALPAIDGLAGAKDIHASRELLLNDLAPDPSRLLAIGEDGIDGYNLIHRSTPPPLMGEVGWRWCRG